jgi:hypothetical protein
MAKFSNGVNGWFSKRLEIEKKKRAHLSGKKWTSFRKGSMR